MSRKELEQKIGNNSAICHRCGKLASECKCNWRNIKRVLTKAISKRLRGEK